MLADILEFCPADAGPEAGLGGGAKRLIEALHRLEFSKDNAPNFDFNAQLSVGTKDELST